MPKKGLNGIKKSDIMTLRRQFVPPEFASPITFNTIRKEIALKVIKGITPVAPKLIIHGLPGSGKSTLASKLKNPIFLDLEGGLSFIDCARTPQIDNDETFRAYIVDLINAAKAGNREYDTVVIDSIDWAIRLLEEQAAGIRGQDPKTGKKFKNLTATLNKANGGYGNGAQYLVNLVRSELIPGLSFLNKLGYSICLVAHSTRKTIMGEDGIDIDRIAPKIHDKVFEVFNEWADDIFYLRNDNGERYLALEGDENILAKNRQGYTGEVKLSDVDINELLTTIKKEK